MENRKREFRELPDETKHKISNATKGRPKSQSHRIHISQSMLKYWQSIPNRPSPENKPSPTETGQII